MLFYISDVPNLRDGYRCYFVESLYKRVYLKNEASQFLRITLSKTKYAAREQRKLDFDIDIQDIVVLLVKQNGNCALTGKPLEFTRGGTFKQGINPNGCTIDRINNSLGYVTGNIQLCRAEVNVIKSSMNNFQFIELCKSVAQTVGS